MPSSLLTTRAFVANSTSRPAVLMDVPDLDAVMASMQTTEATEVMEYDGVLADTLVFLVEEKRRRRRDGRAVSGG
jgi:hypothetical protein